MSDGEREGASGALETEGSAQTPVATDAAQSDSDNASAEERALLALFAGPNAEKFLPVYDRAGAKSPFSLWTWCWPAFFAPFAWFLYRKLWVYASAWFLALLAVGYIAEGSSGIVGVTIAIAG